MKALIIEDEVMAAKTLKKLLLEVSPGVEIVGVLESIEDSVDWIASHPMPDLMFMDIHLADGSSFAIFEKVNITCPVIFTTAYDEYALKAFEVNSIDYLLKPISYEDFLRSTKKALNWFGIRTKEDPLFSDRVIFIKSDYKLHRVLLDEILYIEGVKDYLCFHLKSGETINSLMSMRKVEELLPHPEFLRCNRSFMVRMPEVRTIDRLRIVFGDVFVPITENYRERVMGYLDSHTIA